MLVLKIKLINVVNIVKFKYESNEYCYRIKSAKNINKQFELQKILSENSNTNIVFYNITRFSRNTGQAIDFVNKCIAKNIKLHFAEEISQLIILWIYIDYD